MGCDFFMNPPPDEYESYADWKEKERKKEKSRKAEQPSSEPQPQAPPIYPIDSLAHLLATNPLPSTPIDLSYRDLDGAQRTVRVRLITTYHFEVVSDRRDP